MDPYPPARRADAVDVLHGVEVADPYRWLEDPDDPETVSWSSAQDDLWARHAARLATRNDFAARIESLTPGLVTPPVMRADRRFFERRDVGQNHGVLYHAAADGSDATPLVDPNQLAEDGTVTLDAWSVSPDGRRLAYQLSEGGDEESVLYVLEVDSGTQLDGPIDRCRYSQVAWDDGGRAFFYMRSLAAGEAPDADPHLHRRVYRHVVGTDASGDELVTGSDSPRGSYWSLHTSLDERWLTISSSVGTAPRTDVWIVDLAGERSLRPIQIGHDSISHAWVGPGGQLWILTNRDAPTWRFAATDPERPEPEQWTDVIAARPDAVLEDVAVLDDHLVALWSRDATSRVTVHRPDGDEQHPVELPSPGSVTMTSSPGGGRTLYLGDSDFTSPWQVLEVDAPAGTSSTWATSPGAAAPEGVRTEQVFVTSDDGTRVPMFVVSPDASTGPRPTILYGYGGFDVSLTPEYSSAIAAWVAAGGVYAVANLRGGGEYGEGWHRAGMREHKQRVFEDFEAAAAWLVDEQVTTVPQLGISGGSNGGLLVGAALTRQPGRYAAVVCSAPLLDMVRYERFGLGETWNDEYGRAEDPTEFAWLLSYSPYHRVVEGTPYPATLFTLFDRDTRVDPLHGRKLCAALQWATASDPADAPILLRREADVGHGARSVDRMVSLAADRLAFFAHHLGL